MSHAHTCTECGKLHIVQDIHKEVLNKHKLSMLQTAARHVMDTGVNDFNKNDLPSMTGHSNYANFPKLRYHGLIFKAKRGGEIIKGRWGITRNGWAFLRGDLELPKWVKVQNNGIVERDQETVSVTDVYRGSEVVHTTFEYFDEETGDMVGIRPVMGPASPQQTSLL